MSSPRRLLLDATGRLFGEHCSEEVLTAAAEGTFPEELWRRVEEQGLTTAPLPEEAGGAGLELGDVVAILRQAGRHAAPIPLAETVLAVRLLHENGLDIPEGPLSVAPLGGGELPALGPADGSRRSLTGTISGVPWGGDAHRLLVVAASDDGERLCLLDPAEAERQPGTNLAGEPRDRLRFDAVPVSEADIGPPLPAAALRVAQLLGSLFRAALMAGAQDRVLELAVEHAGERIQFGRPIGRFQAVQQLLAVLAAETAAVGAAVEAAAAASEGTVSVLAIAAAKARASEAVSRTNAIAHQVHGAIGFTQEHVLHHYTRRLWAWRDEAGSEHEWWDLLGAAALEAGADGLWRLLTEESGKATD